MPTGYQKLIVDVFARKLFQSINDGWHVGTISRSAARTRAEVRYATEVHCWYVALEEITDVRIVKLETIVDECIKGVTPTPGGKQAMDEMVRTFMERIGYATERAPAVPQH